MLNEHYPFKCCAVCGLQLATCLTVAHLDHDASNNAADNLARLCQTHHWMYDAGLYPIEAIRLLQAHWQTIRGPPDLSCWPRRTACGGGCRRGIPGEVRNAHPHLLASQSTIVLVSWSSALALTKMPMWPPLSTTSV